MVFIIYIIKFKIVMCAEKIINVLPQLWDSSGDEQYTFKTSIIIILTKLVIVYINNCHI